jgi:HAD superfamily hydrolase (TIGR01484 family)
MKQDILLCSDLDRTILPNGAQAESSQARRYLRLLTARPELALAYVSGRHEALLHQAIEHYDIPIPDYAIGDVGTTIYEIRDDKWRPWLDWADEIAPDWNGAVWEDLENLFHDIDLLRLQEPEKQNTFKLSYYTPSKIERAALLDEMYNRLLSQNINASLIWSVDEAAQVGLLDILPARATKLHAIKFLMERKGFSPNKTVFAGDSGNDLPVLTSGLQAVLVNNAHPDVREEATKTLQSKNLTSQLYLAKGQFLGMNGNYSAGVLEGLVHFLPETRNWLES